jgi:periodic tryptophan protein 1
MSMITATTWVRRGVAAQFPKKYDIDEEEINRISQLARLQLEDAKGDLKAAREGIERDEGGEESEEEGEGGVELKKNSKKGKEKKKNESMDVE